MKRSELITYYRDDARIAKLIDFLEVDDTAAVKITGVAGSFYSFLVLNTLRRLSSSQVLLFSDRERAAYVYNDLENLLGEPDKPINEKRILFYPSSYKRVHDFEHQDAQHILMRTEVLNHLGSEAGKKRIVVSYPAAVAELVADRSYIRDHTLTVYQGWKYSPDALTDKLVELRFERTDFVFEPGQFSVRGGIVDVYSFSEEFPARVEFFGDEVASLRFFDPADQRSISSRDKITLLPNVQDRGLNQQRKSFISILPPKTVLWFDDLPAILQIVQSQISKAGLSLSADAHAPDPSAFLVSGEAFSDEIARFRRVLSGFVPDALAPMAEVTFNTSAQPVFNKNFELLAEKLKENVGQGVATLLLSENENQKTRINQIFHDLLGNEATHYYSVVPLTLHEGFEDSYASLACYTDHQIFDRYHRYRLRDGHKARESINIKELTGLTPGDYITHIEYGIGRFDGLEKINNNGREQEAIRILYGNNDLLYVNIHSLHRISRYVGKEGVEPKLHRLGSSAWKTLKSKTKGKVKDIARELIKLYAARKKSEGFSFSPDTYLQYELEASFFYEDTPDQFQATADIKADMEKLYPMDRLVCGDVGFGKTEVAIRAAFKAVADNKQVAVLVPTTILALQHFQTFSQRLKEFPCKVDYINRFRSTKEIRQILDDTRSGKVDILIGTHRLVSKDVVFKDLGLLIVDEEQKFGVAVKEKLKHMKVNVDTLTLTATPIPRTLQFSMLGARDLSVMNTPPPNRYPVHTEVKAFSSDAIREAIQYEVERGGQVFFVHNRVQNIRVVEDMLKKFVPGVRIAVGHGQMDGKTLEKVMLDFIEGKYDVLLSTTIIESGLDIPNANTMIINDAQNYGLSDLHQLRGRVGRTNRKAFCYLLAPPLSSLTPEARKRLRAIEEFTMLGSGFNIAMRDLDIRGAGNLLGAEQSGFISDIGYEMYQKILDEAVYELRQDDVEFQEQRNTGEMHWVSDCVLETDLELLIPDSYVTNITERLSLYRELETATDDKQLAAYTDMLRDRFGPVPNQTLELIDTVKLRRMARSAGFEKLLLRNGQLRCYFISNPESNYFQSPQFTHILGYAQRNQPKCQFKEVNQRLSVIFPKVQQVGAAMAQLSDLLKDISTAP